MNNNVWATQLIKTLQTSGVEDICLSPGSRSSPLIKAAADSCMRISVHFDERSLGFLALGIAKTSQKPVAIIVTSGTAVGNLLPSIMEASHDDIPLIILSADRPFELLHTGANQTTDQIKIFGSFVRFYMDIPCGDEKLINALTSSVAYAVSSAIIKKGPIHLNCRFREPLIDSTSSSILSSPPLFEEGALVLNEKRILEIAKECEGISEGLILLGQDAPFEALEIANSLKWPLIADISSSLRGYSIYEVLFYESLIKQGMLKSPLVLLQFGKRITSKRLIEWIQKSDIPIYYHIDDSSSRFDPYHKGPTRLIVSPSLFAKSLSEHLVCKHDENYLRTLLSAAQKIEESFEEVLQNSYTEPGFLFTLAKIPIEYLFLANSMPIRDAEAFFFPKSPSPTVFVNRGLSGIDGNIATIAGIAKTLERPLIALIGDLSFLHDLNALAIIHQEKLPILFLIVNNGGGGIFSFLPGLSHLAMFDKLVAYAHPFKFQGIANMFSFPYTAATTWDTFSLSIQAFLDYPTMSILELTTDREENLDFHKKLDTLLYMNISSS